MDSKDNTTRVDLTLPASAQAVSVIYRHGAIRRRAVALQHGKALSHFQEKRRNFSHKQEATLLRCALFLCVPSRVSSLCPPWFSRYVELGFIAVIGECFLHWPHCSEQAAPLPE